MPFAKYARSFELLESTPSNRLCCSQAERRHPCIDVICGEPVSNGHSTKLIRICRDFARSEYSPESYISSHIADGGKNDESHSH